MALDPVVRAALAVLLDVLALAARFAVELHAAPEHLADALDHRAVRIVLGLALGVVLAMDRDPFAGDHRSGQPRPETEHVRDRRVEIDAAMGLAAVQVQGDREDGELGGDQQVQGECAPAGLQQAAGEDIQQ